MTTQEILEAARSAKSALALADNTARNAALLGMADALCSADDQAAILAAKTLAEVEDLYRPYKPKRRTRGSIAREKGLEPLAAAIRAQNSPCEPLSMAEEYLNAEKGVTTGRSRRCGWFDAALLKRSAQVNGLSGLCITKLDVLDGLEELKLCVGYELDGETIDLLPMGADDIARCKPIYETIPGWTDSTVGVTDYDKLPASARRYLDRIAEVTGVPIAMVSTSPDRDHTILMHNPYSAA